MVSILTKLWKPFFIISFSFTVQHNLWKGSSLTNLFLDHMVVFTKNPKLHIEISHSCSNKPCIHILCWCFVGDFCLSFCLFTYMILQTHTHSLRSACCFCRNFECRRTYLCLRHFANAFKPDRMFHVLCARLSVLPIWGARWEPVKLH